MSEVVTTSGQVRALSIGVAVAGAEAVVLATSWEATPGALKGPETCGSAHGGGPNIAGAVPRK